MGRDRVAPAAGPAEDQSAVLLILPPNPPGNRAFRSEVPAQFLEHAEQRNAFHAYTGAHIRDPWLLRTAAGSLRGNHGQTLYASQRDHERVCDRSAPARIHQLRKPRGFRSRWPESRSSKGMKVTCRFAQAKTSSSCRSSSRSTFSGRRDAPR